MVRFRRFVVAIGVGFAAMTMGQGALAADQKAAPTNPCPPTLSDEAFDKCMAGLQAKADKAKADAKADAAAARADADKARREALVAQVAVDIQRIKVAESVARDSGYTGDSTSQSSFTSAFNRASQCASYDASCEYALGFLYADKNWSGYDLAKAYYWMRKAAAHGNADAIKWLKDNPG